MDPSLPPLAAALADRYRIERALGQGGMATVYLAHDLQNDRPVALKVLRPELAAVLGVERFLAEIRTTANLQHPHILPLHDSGMIDGSIYCVMPFVEGQTLRERIERERQLSIHEMVRIAGVIADALDYAHRHGVLHRDVKPENILLSEDHAILADFGIALAITHAGGNRLTETGFSPGTPEYMSPEQAAGEHILDARSDVYSLGAVIYEMLAGEPPITGPNPQAVFAKLMTVRPTSLRVVRPEVPDGIDRAVAKALAKLPADRFQSAGELAAQLTAATTPAVSSRPRRRWLLVAASLVAAVLVVIFAARHPDNLISRGRLKTREPMLLAAFENRTTDSTLAGTLTEALRVDLSQSPVVRLLDPEQVSQLLERMQRPAGTPINGRLARELAQRAGAKALVTAEIAPLGRSYVLSASVISAADGAVLTAVRENAKNDAALLPALDRLSRRLRDRIGESLASMRRSPHLEQVTTASLEALRRYSEAIEFFDRGQYDDAVSRLRQAIVIDTSFAMAWRKLAALLTIVGGSTEQVATAATKAYSLRDRLPAVEHHLAVAMYHTMVDWDPSRVRAAYQAALDVDPGNAIAAGNLAMLLKQERRFAEAESLLLRIPPTGPPWYYNLSEVQASQGHYADARTTIERAVTALPADAGTGLQLCLVSFSQHDYVGAESLGRISAARASLPNQRQYLSALAGFAALAQGKLARGHQDLQAALNLAETRNAPGDYLELTLAEAWSELLLRGRPSQAIALTAAALARHPLDSLPVTDRPYSVLAWFYAEAGRPDEAERLLREYARLVPERQRHGGRAWSYDYEQYMARGAIAIAGDRPEDAIPLLRAYYDSSGCTACGLAELAGVYDRLGQTDSAVTVYHRFISNPGLGRINEDPFKLANTYRRLGELYEAQGRRHEALSYYGKLAELWSAADPELQPLVRDVKVRMARLAGEH